MALENNLVNKQKYGFATGVVLTREILRETSRGLKDLEKISDEDLLECANILDLDLSNEIKILAAKSLINRIANNDLLLFLRPFDVINVVEYLRPIYAMPWKGLTVEKLIEYGWLSITE